MQIEAQCQMSKKRVIFTFNELESENFHSEESADLTDDYRLILASIQFFMTSNVEKKREVIQTFN